MKIVIELVAAVGGIGFIFTAVIAFSSNIIADRQQKKYQLKLDEELEKYKAGLSNKTYISKTKFDFEFEIYKNLSIAFSSCVKAFNILIPVGIANVPADGEKKKQLDKIHYDEAIKAYVDAQDEIEKSIPFIPDDFVEEYNKILKLCSLQLVDFEVRWNVSFVGTYEEKSKLGRESYKRTEEINQQYKEVNRKIRDYIKKLDVL